jgi:hypothetical protein
MTDTANTSISALIVLKRRDDNGELLFDVFHKRFAKHPISPDEFRGPKIVHFMMRADERGWDRFRCNLAT